MRRFGITALLLLSAPAHAGWRDSQVATLSNQLSVAIALKANDVEPSEARALVARTVEGPVVRRWDRIHARQELELSAATTVALMTLDARATPSEQQSWSFEDDEICTPIAGGEVPGTHTRLTAMSPFEASSTGQGAQVFRGPTGQGDALLTWLKPGESVTMVEAVNDRGQLTAERVELAQHGRLLTLQREGQQSEACYLQR